MSKSKGRKKRGRRYKRLLWPLEYILVAAVGFIVRLLPFRAALAFGGVLGELAFRIDKRHRLVTEENLSRSLPELPSERRAGVARTVFRNLGYSVIELIHSSRYGRDPLERHFRFVNYEAFERASAKGRGVLLLTAHCGSWELMALAQSIKGHPFGVVVRPLDNPYLERAVARIRSRFGNEMIGKNRGMRAMLRTLAEGRAVGVLLDQNVARREGVFVDFFGRPACTNVGLALIASRTKAPVIPAFTRRIGPDMHEIVLGNELPLVDTGDKEADIAANTQMYTRQIEEFVRKYPDQWFWVHRRWKTRPEGASDA